jgi:hypothetical protein
MPVFLKGSSEEHETDMEKTNFLVRIHNISLRGFIIDENDFEVAPAISRLLQVFEVDTKTTKNPKKKIINDNPNIYDTTFLYSSGVTEVSKKINLNVNLSFQSDTNIESYDVYINNNYYGASLTTIEINSGDDIRIVVVKTDNTKEGKLLFTTKIL